MNGTTTWSDRWTIKSIGYGEVRETTLTKLLVALKEETSKPDNETGYVLTLLTVLKDGLHLDKVEAYFDGNLLLGA